MAENVNDKPLDPEAKIMVISKDGVGRWPMQRKDLKDFLKSLKLEKGDVTITSLEN